MTNYTSRLFITLVAISIVDRANAVIWDDFNVTDQFVAMTFEPTNVRYVESELGVMGTGERDFGYFGFETTLLSRAERRTRSFGEYGLALFYRGQALQNGSGPTLINMTLQYDGVGDESGNLGFGRTLNNTGAGSSLPTLGGFRMFLIGGDSDHPFSVTLRRAGTVVAEKTAFPDFSSGGGRTWLNFPFTSQELLSADSVSFTYHMRVTGGTSASIAISRIETMVPEPGTWLAVAGGLALLCRRRRMN